MVRILCRLRWLVLALCGVLALPGCGGGGNSTVTSITGGGINAQGASAAVSLPYTFVQTVNNMPVLVDAGPAGGFSLAPNANILYASVTVCEPGSTTRCQTIDHVQVDTGSVGLRVLASKVSQLNLQSPPVGSSPVWECYPFVVGGLWGASVVADVGLGQQTASAVPIQLIQDDATAAVQATVDCANATNNQILTSAAALGANGILGIGSVTLDCGSMCQTGVYTGTFIQYYQCPAAATSSSACSATAVPVNMQTYNPVAAIPDPAYNHGVVLNMPAVTLSLGAASASGELVFGIDTQSNNQTASVPKVYLGTQPSSSAYLNISTIYQGQTYTYLDTGTNTLVFPDSALPLCSGSGWYCPPAVVSTSATLANGDAPAQNQVVVDFSVGNADALFSTINTAYSNLAAPAPANAPTFVWGLPFFYGRRVSMAIWDLVGAVGPWYAWSTI